MKEFLLGMVIGFMIMVIVKCNILHEDNEKILERLDKMMENGK